MRALALLFIIANLAYFGWTTLIDVPVVPTHAGNPHDANVQRLILAVERDKAVANAANLSAKTALEKADAKPSEPVPAAQVTENEARCISVGPFQDLASASQASATLKTAGHESRQRLEQGELWVGYWVNVPNFPKREDAERAVGKLKQNGIDDVYISLNAEASNIVSLGVFKEADRAQRRMNEAKALGFAPQISERTRTGSVYWADVDLPAGAPAIDLAVLGAQPGKILRLEQRACLKDSK